MVPTCILFFLPISLHTCAWKDIVFLTYMYFKAVNMRRTLSAQHVKKVVSDISSLGQVISGLVGFAVRLASFTQGVALH